MTGPAKLLDAPWLYRLWQAPFARQKLAPVGDLGRLRRARSVLEVACGPGNHAHLFAPEGYLGLDMNPRYVEAARRRLGPGFAGRFEVADARSFAPEAGQTFELVFSGSFLHHLSDGDARRVLANLARLLEPGGRLVLMDLVLPEGRGPGRWLARADRGDYPRSLGPWQELLEECFDLERCEPYRLSLLGLPLWHMIYAEGTPR